MTRKGRRRDAGARPPAEGRAGAKPRPAEAPAKGASHRARLHAAAAPRAPTPAAPRAAGERPAGRPHAREPRESDFARIFGFHSVQAALKAPRRELIRLYATSAAAERLAAEIAARGVETRIVSAEEIAARLPREAVHQGVLLEAQPLAPIDLADLPERGLVLVLDQITDPHNVGAIVRTAAAFAVDAIVTTERHSPEFTGTLAKSASGGLEHVPICVVTNLARAMTELGEMGYWRIGLDSEAPVSLAAAPLSRPLALALGAEGKGLRRLTREHCDAMARLDLPGAIRSLNVSNACAVALSLVHAALSRAD